MSQLLQRIDADLQSISDREVAGRLLCKKAAYLARVGRFDESKGLVAELRTEFASSRSGPVTPWIMLTEGLLHYFETLDPLALDRVTRTLLLAQSLNDQDLIATSAAWKAHMEFERCMFESMSDSLQICAKHAATTDHSALCRMSMVMCDSLLCCGEKKAAQTWFLKSRDHALHEGDQASIEAIVYNRAAFNLAWARAQSCLGADVSESLPLIRLEWASARNLLGLTGISALTHTVAICEARLLLLEKDFSEAVRRFEELRISAPRVHYNFSDSLLELELFFARMKDGQVDALDFTIDGTCIHSFDSLDTDDRLAAAWIAREIAKSGHSTTEVGLTEEFFAAAREAYEQTVVSIRLAVQPLLLAPGSETLP